jgi:hypothetical protein
MQEVHYTFTWQPSCAAAERGSTAVAAGVSLSGAGVGAAAGGRGRTATTTSSKQQWFEPFQLLGVKCKVTADVPVAVELLEELGEMVDSKEEGLLLDTLAVISWPLAAVGRLVLQQRLRQEPAAAPAVPAAATAAAGGALGMLSVSLAMHDSPYRLQLLLLQDERHQQRPEGKVAGVLAQRVIVVQLALASHGRVALSFPALSAQQQANAAATATAAAGEGARGQQEGATARPDSVSSSSNPSGLSLPQFVRHLAAVAPGVPVVQKISSSSTSYGRCASSGCIWVHAATLPVVLEQLLQYMLTRQERQQQFLGGS